VPLNPLSFETLHGGSAIRFLGSIYATARTSVVIFITGKHLLPGGMTREVGQGSGSSERMGGYDRFISLLFYVLQIIYVSYVHVYCFVCNHEFISSVLSYYIMICLMSVHASNMLYVLMIHIVMDIFDIIISMINHLLYVIIIMLIYGIKMIWKMPIFLTENMQPSKYC
jgi:hypothetical protein